MHYVLHVGCDNRLIVLPPMSLSLLSHYINTESLNAETSPDFWGGGGFSLGLACGSPNPSRFVTGGSGILEQLKTMEMLEMLLCMQALGGSRQRGRQSVSRCSFGCCELSLTACGIHGCSPKSCTSHSLSLSLPPKGATTFSLFSAHLRFLLTPIILRSCTLDS